MYVLNKDKLYYVYMYTSPSGRHYVGRSCNAKEIRSGRGGIKYHDCTAFWNAIQKYGWENFAYQVLEENIQSDEIDKRENYWIDFYHASTDENGYNLLKPDGDRKTYTEDSITKLSQSHIGQTPWNKGRMNVYSGESLKRMSDGHVGKPSGMLGKHLSEETKEKLRQYRGEKSSRWGTHPSEETKAKLSTSNKGKHKQNGKDNPMYGKHHSEETKRKISESRKGKLAGDKNPMYGVHLIPSDETRKKLSDASSAAVLQYDLDGNYVAKYKSRKEAAAAVNGRACAISACCNGNRKSYLGFQWCNVCDGDKITSYVPKNRHGLIACLLDGNVVQIYDGINAANRALGKTGSNISKCLKNPRQTAYGYHWRYADDLAKDS